MCRILVRSVDVDGCAARTLMKRSHKCEQRSSATNNNGSTAPPQPPQQNNKYNDNNSVPWKVTHTRTHMHVHMHANWKWERAEWEQEKTLLCLSLVWGCKECSCSACRHYQWVKRKKRSRGEQREERVRIFVVFYCLHEQLIVICCALNVNMNTWNIW